MNNQTKYDIPWELIADFLTGDITNEQNHQLQDWIAMNDENKASFVRIRKLWTKGTEDYSFYKTADSTAAWNALQYKLNRETGNTDSKVIKVEFNPKRRLIRNLLAIASVCIGIIVLVWFFTLRSKPEIFLAGTIEQRRITLSDGSVITLKPLTRIEVTRRFNTSDRKVVMTSGEADFEVVHRNDLPFVVVMDGTEIRDIGTSFIIRRKGKMIHVAVSNGEVAFIRTSTKESLELKAGSSVSYNEQKKEFGDITSIESSEAFEDWLNFEGTPLSRVITGIQKVYTKQIKLSGDISNRKLTAKLHGMPFSTAIEVICTSLDLEYSVHDNIYVLKAKSKDE